MQKVALITGAARRIGAAIACFLHKHDWNVVIHYHMSAVEAQALVQILNQTRPNSAQMLAADLTQIAGLATLANQAKACWGRLDALINNASKFVAAPVAEVDEALWDELLTTNAKAPFFLAQACAAALAETQGAIVNMTDSLSVKPFQDYTVYTASKAALAALTFTLAQQLGPRIRVNAVAPGAIEWPENVNVLSELQKQSVIEATALKQAGKALDVAKAVYYLLTQADFVTGQTLPVDGGRYL
jgi:pteridine reductase